jgi:hypothetical protein
VVASLEGMARVRMASCAPTVTGARAAPSGPSSAGMTGTASGDLDSLKLYNPSPTSTVSANRELYKSDSNNLFIL